MIRALYEIPLYLISLTLSLGPKYFLLDLHVFIHLQQCSSLISVEYEKLTVFLLHTLLPLSSDGLRTPLASVHYQNRSPETSWSIRTNPFLHFFLYVYGHSDRLCGLVVRVLGYRSGGRISIPCSTRFSKKKENNSGSGTGCTQPREYKLRSYLIENREYGRRDPSRWPRGTLYPQKLATTPPTSGGRSVGIDRSRTRTMEFVFMWT
jgi:hypothetical protein